MYPLYFLPKRVVEEYQTKIHNAKSLTTPIIKRKISAMIHATKYCRIDLGNGKYKHRFGHCKMVVEENNQTVSKVEYTIIGSVHGSDGKFYDRLCKEYYGLNDKHTEFAETCRNNKIVGVC